VHVELKTEGGVAFFPGLARPFVLDTAALSAEETERLNVLVEACRFFDRPDPAPPARRGADAREYVLTIEVESTGRRTLHLRDPVTPDLADLLDFLRAKQRESRPG
jgi:Emfourin